MTRFCLILLGFVFLAVASNPRPAFADTPKTGGLRVQITDADGNPIPGIYVSLPDAGMGRIREVGSSVELRGQTDENGVVEFTVDSNGESLVSDVYNVGINASKDTEAQFRLETRFDPVFLPAGEKRTLEIQLGPLKGSFGLDAVSLAIRRNDKELYDQVVDSLPEGIRSREEDIRDWEREAEAFRTANDLDDLDVDQIDQYLKDIENIPESLRPSEDRVRALRYYKVILERVDSRRESLEEYREEVENIPPFPEQPPKQEDKRTGFAPFGGNGAFVSLSGGGGVQQISEVSVGTVILPGGEAALVSSDDRVTVATVGGAVGYDFGDVGPFDNFTASLAVEFGWGDTDASNTEPIAGRPVALTLHQDNPVSTSTGIAAGNTGARATSEVDFSYHDIRLRAQGEVPLGPRITVIPGVAAIYGRGATEAQGSFQSLVFPGFSSRTDQDADDHYLGVGLGADVAFHVHPNVEFFVGGGVDLLQRWGSLSDRQRTLCDVCANPADQDFTVDFKDSDSGFTYAASAKVGVAIEFEQLEVYVAGGVEYLKDRSVIRNRISPAQDDTFLDSKDVLNGSARLTLTYRF